MPQTRKELISDYEDLLKTQLSSGNWDYDSYMHGMANGMLLFHSMAVDPTVSPDFISSPKFWKSRLWRNVKKIRQFRQKLWLYFQWTIASIISSITGLEFQFENKTLIKYREQ